MRQTSVSSPCTTIATAGWTRGVHDWNVQLVRGNHVQVGVALEGISECDFRRNIALRVALFCSSGRVGLTNGRYVKCFHDGAEDLEETGGYPDGTIISVRLDCNSQAIQFAKNHGSYCQPISGLPCDRLYAPKDVLYPFFSLTDSEPDAEIKIWYTNGAELHGSCIEE
jgi:hypothetical protein